MIKDGVLELELLSGKVQPISAEQSLLPIDCTKSKYLR